eukprot:jgi/Tetstr1/465950/TSEL_000913.t1
MVFKRNYGKMACPHTKTGAVVGAASKSAAKPLPAVGKKPPIMAANKSTVTHLQEQLDAARIMRDGRNEQLKAASLELERQVSLNEELAVNMRLQAVDAKQRQKGLEAEIPNMLREEAQSSDEDGGDDDPSSRQRK